MDYKKTSVRINNEKEFTNAIEFCLNSRCRYDKYSTRI